MRERFIYHRFNGESEARVVQAVAIVEEYAADGYRLTLRQLYYQFVARDLIPNTKKSYDSLGSLISNARLAGRIDWDAIEDRTRSFKSHSYDTDPVSSLLSVAEYFELDPWESQEVKVEAWIEKDALLGVLQRACRMYGVPYFSCRGYPSQSAIYEAANRHKEYKKRVIVLHLGDHDPSGVDMTRDIAERLELFGSDAEVRRIALTMEQVDELKPPPNFAKVTDTRSPLYVKRWGKRSWELDALPPQYVEQLVNEAVKKELDEEAWNDVLIEADEIRKSMVKFVNGFKPV